jgi:hypothetical protein
MIMAQNKLSPGVIVTEQDKTQGTTVVGNGSIGIAAKLNKGAIGIPFQITSENELINRGGMPIAGFNLQSWHSIDNLLLYAGSVLASRVEKTEYSAKHDLVNQMFEIPVNSAQVGVTLTGNTIPFNFSDELQMMIKNRTSFTTENVDDANDVLNDGTGMILSDLDNSILLTNDADLEVLVENSALNTKTKTTYNIAKLGSKEVIYDYSVPDLKVGDVYNHNGKIIDIGSNIYDDTFIVEITASATPSMLGTGSFVYSDSTGGSDRSNVLHGVGTAFSSEVKKGSVLLLNYNIPYGSAYANTISNLSTVKLEASKRLNLTINNISHIADGDTITLHGVTFTFKNTVVTPTTQIKIETTATATLTNIKTIVDANTTLNPIFTLEKASDILYISLKTAYATSTELSTVSISFSGGGANEVILVEGNGFATLIADANTALAGTYGENTKIKVSSLVKTIDYIEKAMSLTTNAINDIVDTNTIAFRDINGDLITFTFKDTVADPATQIQIDTSVVVATQIHNTMVNVKTMVDANALLNTKYNLTVDGTTLVLGLKKSYLTTNFGGGTPAVVLTIGGTETLTADTRYLYLKDSLSTTTTWANSSFTFAYFKQQTKIVDKIISDTTLNLTTVISGIEFPVLNEADKSSYFYFKNTDDAGLTTTAERIYRDAADTTYTTIKGVNVNFYNLIRIGSYISFNVGAGDIKGIVTSIVDKTTMKVTATSGSWATLPTTIATAANFTYKNAYCAAAEVNNGTILYTNSCTCQVVECDESSDHTDVLKYIVKVLTGSLSRDAKISVGQLKTTEWSSYTTYISNVVDMVKESNMYMLKIDADIATHIERGATVEIYRTAYTTYLMATGTVELVTSADSDSIKYLVLTMGETGTTRTNNDYNNTGIKSKIAAGYFVKDTSNYRRISGIINYTDVKVYENIEDLSTEMLVMNETGWAVAITANNTGRYTYTFGIADKAIWTDTSITSTPLTATEFMRVFAYNAGAWINSEDITFAMCDMDNWNTATITPTSATTFKSLFEFQPDTTDKTLIAILVMKSDIVVEKYIVSTNPTSKDELNVSRYITDIINKRSTYIRVLVNTTIFNPAISGGYNISFNTIYSTSLTDGYSGKKFTLNTALYYDTTSSVTDVTSTNGYTEISDVLTALELFRNVDDVSINYLVDGEWAGNVQVINKMVDICSDRTDSIAIIAPAISDIVGIKDPQVVKNNILRFVQDNNLSNGDKTSQFYGIFANCKKIYDVFNDTNVWLPISVDVTGLNSYVDNYLNIWDAAAGLTRANIRNFIALGWNPDKYIRDELYPARINPVVTFKGEGTVVWGVRSLCTRKSDLSDLYNRKTLNYISKNLSRFLRSVLFEFNDAQTRGQVLALVEPFLRGIKAKRGLNDYKVVCDDSNNPATIIEQNTLVCDVFLKMQHVVEIVELNFIITKNSASFTEQ